MKIVVEHENGTNKDIINSMLNNVDAAINQAHQIKHKFDKGSEEKTARAIWQFLNNKIDYKLDPDGEQNIYMPLRLIEQGGADCKSFAMFAAAMLAALGYNSGLRFASYDGGAPSHVYAYSDNFIIDGCLPFFDYEKEYTNNLDFDIMEIRSIHGVQTREIGVIKKVVYAPARLAFRTLVSLNFLGLATRLKRALTVNSAKVENTWKKGFGGDFDGLKKSINKGAARRPLFKKTGTVNGYHGEAVGAIQIAAVLAAAAPVLAAMSGLLKSLGLQEPKEEEEVNEVLTPQDKLDAAKALNTPPDPKEVDDTPKEGKNNTILLVGVAALAFFLINKK